MHLRTGWMEQGNGNSSVIEGIHWPKIIQEAVLSSAAAAAHH